MEQKMLVLDFDGTITDAAAEEARFGLDTLKMLRF